MPLFYQHNINEDERLGVWKIEENEDFFLEKVPANLQISHEHKRLQHLAGRYLLQQLFPDFPYELIQIADTRKPFLFNEAYHFSISHCNNYAAALVSRWRRVGVDIEVVTPAIRKIRHKFLNDFEMEILDNENSEALLSSPAIMVAMLEADKADLPLFTSSGDVKNAGNDEPGNFQQGISSPVHPGPGGNLPLLTLCWSAKEAMYKWYGSGLVDFKNHMQLRGFDSQPPDDWISSEFVFQKEKPVPLKLRSRFFGDAVLSWVIS